VTEKPHDAVVNFDMHVSKFTATSRAVLPAIARLSVTDPTAHAV